MSEFPIIRVKTKAGQYMEYPLNKDEVTVGRSVKADIMIDDASVSRIHFKVIRENDAYMIVDNQSSNGTYLRKRKVIKEMLRDGDDIFAGRVHIYFSNKMADGVSPDQGLETAEVNVNSYKETDEFPALSIFDELPTPKTAPEPSFPAPPLIQQEMPPSAPPINPTPPPQAPPMGGPVPPPQPAAPMAPPPMMPQAPAPPAVQPPTMAPPQPAYPSFGDQTDIVEEGFASPIHRLLAVFIDSFLAMILYGVVFALPFLGVPGGVTLGLSALVGLFLFLHPLLGWILYGKTIGKHLLGLRIVMIDNPGKRGLSFKCFLLRAIGYMISGMLFCLPFITVITDADGRGLHDKMAGTKVVKS